MVNENINKKLDAKASSKSKKEKVQVTSTKIVIRKLPPSFTEEEFRNSISPVPENNYFSFFPADKGLASHAFSRAYINFINAEEVFSFRDIFDGYVFVDQKGNEYPALVEYASFQKIPKSNHQKKDIRCGTIDEDPDYVAFLDLLQNPETVILPQIETLLEEIENIERETRANNGVLKVKTPLLEYVEQRNAERYRPGDKKRRKEFDRKKAREEEKRKRKDIKEYRKREDHYARDEREKERTKRREEDRLKWKEKKEEKEKQIRKDKLERYKSEDRPRTRDYSEKYDEPTEEKYTPRSYSHEKEPSNNSGKVPYSPKEEKGKGPIQKTKRYSEARKKDDREKKHREDKSTKTVPEHEAKEEVEERCVDDVEPVPPPIERKEEDRTKIEENVEVEREESEKRMEKEESIDKEDMSKGETEAEKADDSEDKDDRNSRDPRTERRIRNKDRPAMQLYRPGQSRLKSRLKQNDEGGERSNEGDSSSSSASPIMGMNEDKKEEINKPPPTQEKEKEREKEEQEVKGSSAKSNVTKAAVERKIPKYRESRSYHWESEWDERKAKVEGELKSESKGGGRKGYSYHHERESKGKLVGRSKEHEAQGSDYKSVTYRRSTSQE